MLIPLCILFAVFILVIIFSILTLREENKNRNEIYKDFSYTALRKSHTSEYPIEEYHPEDSIQLSHKNKNGEFVSTWVTLSELKKILEYV